MCYTHNKFKTSIRSIISIEKKHRIITFNQEAWLTYTDMNRAKKNVKNDFEKDFFKLMNKAVFGKIMKYVRKYRDIKLVINKSRRNYLAYEPNYHITIFSQ